MKIKTFLIWLIVYCLFCLPGSALAQDDNGSEDDTNTAIDGTNNSDGTEPPSDDYSTPPSDVGTDWIYDPGDGTDWVYDDWEPPSDDSSTPPSSGIYSGAGPINNNASNSGTKCTGILVPNVTDTCNGKDRRGLERSQVVALDKVVECPSAVNGGACSSSPNQTCQPVEIKFQCFFVLISPTGAQIHYQGHTENKHPYKCSCR